MSVRRLADQAVQPPTFAFNRSNAAWAKRKLKNYPKGREASAVIPLLMRAQEQDGWVTRAAIEHVAGMLDMPLIRVLEVATFYTQFQLAPVGKRAHVQVCGTTPCMLRGAGDLIETCKKRIGPNQFETTADGKLSWEEVECQGACVNAPMVMIFKDTYEDLTPERLEEIIDAFDAGKGDSIEPGPQIDRIYSAPEGGLTTLTGVPAKASRGPAAKKAPAAAKKPASAAKAKSTTKAKSSSSAKPTAAAKTAKSVAKTKVATKAKPAAKAKPVAATKAKSAAVGLIGKAPAKATAAKKSTAKPKATPKKAVKSADAGKPAAMKKPRQPDDLKMISGVGPKIEGILNGLGIYKFDQVAKWRKAERDWVDGYLSFKGRIDREDWVKQAKALAKGGAEEYIRVFGKKPR